jgi:protein-disulfide reductase (glutathione)
VAQSLASNEKPIMLFFNQPWCGACNRLKDNLKQEGKKLKELSQSFLLINVAGEENNSFDVSMRMPACSSYQICMYDMHATPEQPTCMQATYAPDGGYIPRMLFAEPSGKLRPEITNPSSGEQHKYFYQSVDQVMLSMLGSFSVNAAALLLIKKLVLYADQGWHGERSEAAWQQRRGDAGEQ